MFAILHWLCLFTKYLLSHFKEKGESFIYIKITVFSANLWFCNFIFVFFLLAAIDDETKEIM